MADEAKIVVRAEDQASQVFKQVGDNANKMASEISGGTQKAADGTQKLTDKILGNREGLVAVGAASAATFAGVAALVKDSTDRFATFEKQMSEAKAVLGLFGNDDTTKQQFKELTDLAIKLGADTKFTAKEAAEGITVLGQAGFSTGEIMKTMSGVMNLAAATNISIADSADIASSVLRQYSLNVEETGRVMDVLNKTSVMSNADILNLRDSFNYFGSTAHVLGISLEESSAAIGILANNGIKGSAATRALGTALTRLASPTKKMQGAMDELGFSAFDQNGKFIGLAGIVDQLNKEMAGYTQQQKAAAVSAIFGADAYGEMSILLEAGTDKLKDFTKELQNAGGTTDNMAKVQLDNLKGSIELLSGAFDSMMIKLGSAFAPIVREIVDALRPIMEAIGSRVSANPQLAATILIVIGALTGLTALLAGIGLIVPSIIAGFTLMGTVITAVGGFIAAFGAPILAVIAVVALLYEAWKTNFGGIRDYASAAWDEIKSTFSGAIEWVKQTWTMFLHAIGIDSQADWDNFILIITTVWDGLKLYLETIMAYIFGVIKTAWDVIKTYVGGTLTGIRDLVIGAITFIAGFFSKDGKAKMEEGRNLMVGGLVGIIKAPLNATIALIEGMVNAAIDAVNKLIAAANSLPGGLIKISPVPKLSIPRLAKGGFADMSKFQQMNGIVSGPMGIDKVPTMLTDGELVLNKAQQSNLAGFIRGNGDGGNVIEVHVSGNNFYGDDTTFAEKIGDMIVKQLKTSTAFASF